MLFRGLVFSCLFGLTVTVQAHSACNDPGLNKLWRDAGQDIRADSELGALSAMRDELCQMIAGDQIDAETAHLLWEKTLAKAFIKQSHGAHAKLVKAYFPRLYGTF